MNDDIDIYGNLIVTRGLEAQAARTLVDAVLGKRPDSFGLPTKVEPEPIGSRNHVLVSLAALIWAGEISPKAIEPVLRGVWGLIDAELASTVYGAWNLAALIIIHRRIVDEVGENHSLTTASSTFLRAVYAHLAIGAKASRPGTIICEGTDPAGKSITTTRAANHEHVGLWPVSAGERSVMREIVVTPEYSGLGWILTGACGARDAKDLGPLDPEPTATSWNWVYWALRKTAKGAWAQPGEHSVRDWGISSNAAGAIRDYVERPFLDTALELCSQVARFSRRPNSAIIWMRGSDTVTSLMTMSRSPYKPAGVVVTCNERVHTVYAPSPWSGDSAPKGWVQLAGTGKIRIGANGVDERVVAVPVPEWWVAIVYDKAGVGRVVGGEGWPDLGRGENPPEDSPIDPPAPAGSPRKLITEALVELRHLGPLQNAAQGRLDVAIELLRQARSALIRK